MSYNLLLDTGFNKKDKHWKFTNCVYEDGYLIASSKLFAVEQEITLPNPTKLYSRFDYITFDKNIKQIFMGIQCGDVLETSVKKPSIGKRQHISVINQSNTCTVKIKLIIESETDFSRVYVDSPILIDLTENKKLVWSKSILDKVLDYRYGFDYENLYSESEFSMQNPDLFSVKEFLTKGNCGVVLFAKKDLQGCLSLNGKMGHTYLVKLDYITVNDYGSFCLNYGELQSTQLDENQQYIIISYNANDKLKITISNQDIMPYIINLRHILIADITDNNIDVNDIPHMPYI